MRHEGARGEWLRREEDQFDDGGVTHVVPDACPRLDMRRRSRRGVKLGVQAEGLSFHPMVTGEGKAGRVNMVNPRLMSR